jgi:hypothetical protein
MIVSGTYLRKISNESSLSFVLSMSRLGDPLADCYCHAVYPRGLDSRVYRGPLSAYPDG